MKYLLAGKPILATPPRSRAAELANIMVARERGQNKRAERSVNGNPLEDSCMIFHTSLRMTSNSKSLKNKPDLKEFGFLLDGAKHFRFYTELSPLRPPSFHTFDSQLANSTCGSIGAGGI